MLECELCNYLRNLDTGGGEGPAQCEFTGHLFGGQNGFDLEEYPCRNRSFDEYIKSLQTEEYALQEKDERPNKKVLRLAGDDWRLHYLRGHTATGYSRKASA